MKHNKNGFFAMPLVPGVYKDHGTAQWTSAINKFEVGDITRSLTGRKNPQNQSRTSMGLPQGITAFVPKVRATKTSLESSSSRSEAPALSENSWVPVSCILNPFL